MRPKRTGITTEPTAQEMLDFVLACAAFPYELTIGGPSNSGRPKDSQWYFSYKRKDNKTGFDACVYAPTRREAILKAMRVFAAQEKARKLLQEAQA